MPDDHQQLDVHTEACICGTPCTLPGGFSRLCDVSLTRRVRLRADVAHT